MIRHHRLDGAGRDALREAAPMIVAEFRGEPNRALSSRKEMRWGSHGSLSLVTRGLKAGLWFDHEQGRGGDVVEFIRIERGCSFQEVLDYAASFVPGLHYGEPAPRRPDRPAHFVSDLDDDAGDERRIERALTIWSETVSLRGTPAEGYLRSRAIEVPDEALDVLKFHPACPWEDSRRPALVALIRDVVTNEPAAIHRTALTADGSKIERRALGSKGGGAIKLAPDAGITGELTIAEGIETALSAMTLGFGPAWSVIDAGEMSKFPVLPGLDRLTLVVDNDVNETGQRAAAEAKARWERAGRRVRTVTPATPGQDANDVLRARLGF